MKCFFALSMLLMVVCISCGPKKISRQYDLTDEQLARLMLDLQFADAALGEVNGVERDSLKEILWVKMAEIYEHPVDKLESEVRKLESDHDKLDLVMDRVQVLLDSIR